MDGFMRFRRRIETGKTGLLAVEGDSAFDFYGMEVLETIAA